MPETNTSPKTGYVNGSDMLLYVGDVAVGSCTSHTTTFSSETKERAVKPAAQPVLGAGLRTRTRVVALRYSISAEGLCFYDEAEYGYAQLLGAWKTGQAITVKCMERATKSDDTPAPYLVGPCVITNLERTDPAQDDSTYSLQLDNAGEPTTLDESKIS